ncbi:MAG: hypothetical protein GYB40_02230 [Vibrionaceae bacterium]|nr:hypothetical protein [Vibrionaceae bacterium]
MNSDSRCIDQAESLRRLMKRQICKDKLKDIHVELRRAIIAGKYKDVDTLMVLVDKAQNELEETY